MHELVFDPGVAAWVAGRIPHVGGAAAFGPHSALGFARNGALIAGAVFHNWRGHDIELSFAASDPRWARRGNIRAVFHYPFVQLGCVRFTAVTARGNERAHKLLRGLGFTQEGVLRRGFDGTADAFVFAMLREECHWLEDNHGKQKHAEPAAAARSGCNRPGAVATQL